jgi:hypothetical protein
VSTNVYEVSIDAGNWAGKGVRDGKTVTIRNVATEYDGSNDALIEMKLFGDTPTEHTRVGGEQTESARIQLADKQWIVGEAAYSLSALAHERTTYARYGTEEWYALIAALLSRLFKKSGTVNLTFSLPISQFRIGKHHEVKEWLSDEWRIYDHQQDRELAFNVDPDQIDMVVEGFGTLAYVCLSENGRSFSNRSVAAGRTVIFDFGGFTLDILTFNSLSIGAYNESITTGLINVRNAVNKALKARYGRGDVPGDVLDEVIRTGHYRHAGGKPESVQDIVDAALVGLMKGALRVWNEELGSGADIDTVIISGGGGPVIGPLIVPQLGHANTHIIPAGEAHLANAIGTLRHKRFKQHYVRT